uniref:DNA-directed RNA polymerase subunit beta'' n=1 Tax=Eutreptiella eupharyngea TaxID=215702 RepID=A0A977K848_9EUGL|nr:RNA polymerase beta'' subunit [Eutreptiella eupharyngea]UXD06351.1 RNA polymerase beta'' subunit [Eutreptiella eupharyngea]
MESFFCNRTFDKGEMRKLIQWFLINYGTARTAKLVDRLKTLGFHYATKAGISLGLEDLKIPPIKTRLLKNAEIKIEENEERFLSGKITAVEKLQKVIDVWNTTNELLKNEVIVNFRQTDLLNPVYMMAFSGARGNISQVRQLVGMRGLMADSQGEIIDLPIKSNFREGLNVTEYLISCYGARKGLVDTALRTANSGYLTRRLVDVAQSVIINKTDCGTYHGILISPLIKNKKTYISIEKRLIGRVLAKDIYDDQKRKLIASRGQDICSYLAPKILQKTKQKIYVRSPLTCESNRCICQLCYGWSLAHGRLAQIGEAVGIIAAQSIGEPGTQLTMRTFHTGGVFAGNVADRIYAPHDGILEYFSDSGGKTIRTQYGEDVFFTFTEKKLFIKETELNTSTLTLPRYTIIFIKPGQKIFAKQIIAEMSSIAEIMPNSDKSDWVEASKEVKTDVGGQIYFDNLITVQQRNSSDKLQEINKSQNVTKVKENGLIWVLNGNLLSFLTIFKKLSVKHHKRYMLSEQDSLTNHKFKIFTSTRPHKNFKPKPGLTQIPTQTVTNLITYNSKYPLNNLEEISMNKETLFKYQDYTKIFNVQINLHHVHKLKRRMKIGSQQNKIKLIRKNKLTKFTRKYKKPTTRESYYLETHENITFNIQKTKKKELKVVRTDHTMTRKKKQYCQYEEITVLNSNKQCLTHNDKNQVIFNTQRRPLNVKIGDLIYKGYEIAKGVRSTQSGQIISIQAGQIILRKGIPNLASENTLVGVNNRDLIAKNNFLFHLVYKKPKTGDIVQGLPKIEELLEARRTKDLQPIIDNPHEKLKQQFDFYKQKYDNATATRKSAEKIQQFLVNGIQLVYQSQGIEISDKHIEIIVKQMTSKVLIEEGGETSLLSGEVIEINRIEKINKNIIKKAKYQPILLGITKASLNTESFISAASFQETTRVLIQAAIEGKTDWLYGLKENVILGRLIPAGTGFKTKEKLSQQSQNKEINSILDI